MPHSAERALQRKGVRAAYEALEDEYALLRELLRARLQAGPTQDQMANAMGTEQKSEVKPKREKRKSG